METRTVLIASLVLNGILAGSSGFLFVAGKGAKLDYTSPSVELPSPSRYHASNVVPYGTTAQISSGTSKRPFQWGEIESRDYREYIANLRRIACPELTIRDIIIAEINRLYQPKLSALRAGASRFWQARMGPQAREANETATRIRQSEKEKNDVIRELLGIDLNVREEMFQMMAIDDQFDRALGFLPEKRRGPAKAVLEKYSELERAVHQRAGGILLESDHEELRRLRAARAEELTHHLSLAEVEEYDLRASETAERMRWNLAAFEPTEQEFRALFRPQKDFERRFDPNVTMAARDPELLREQAEAQQMLHEKIRDVLGAERFEDYRRSQDPSFRQLIELAGRFEFSREKALEVYEIKQALERTLQGPQQPIGALPAQIQDIRSRALQEARQATGALIGSAAYDAYLRRGGHWLSDDPR